MSGHSKWSTIKRQKGVNDAKRGQLFTKLGNAITVAVKTGGGGDPGVNFRLRLAIEQAKKANMPQKNIDRAIDRGLGKGEEGETIEEIRYEAYGPEGVALLIDVATNNRQRTVATIKNILERSGGRIASPGSVAWQFDAAGLAIVHQGDQSPDELSLQLIDAGAKDLDVSNGQIFAYVAPKELSSFVQKLKDDGFAVSSAELTMRPKTTVSIHDSSRATKLLRLVDALDDVEDVQQVYANFDIPDAILNTVEEQQS